MWWERLSQRIDYLKYTAPKSCASNPNWLLQSLFPSFPNVQIETNIGNGFNQMPASSFKGYSCAEKNRCLKYFATNGIFSLLPPARRQRLSLTKRILFCFPDEPSTKKSDAASKNAPGRNPISLLALWWTISKQDQHQISQQFWGMNYSVLLSQHMARSLEPNVSKP